MLIKNIHLTQIDPLLEFLPEAQTDLTKHASFEDLSPEIKAAYVQYKGKAPANQTYLMVVALGAGEYWGANRNGDYFSEKDLVSNYKHFLKGHVFLQHKNKDPKAKIGDILAAGYNNTMHRVELIISIYKQLAPEIYLRVQSGDLLEVSMGTRVAYDICSICGNRASRREDYCEHLRVHMGEILDDGRQVYAINPNPVFFDCSVVRVGADPTAKGLMKVASDLDSLVEKGAKYKVAEIEKEVPADTVADSNLLDILDNLYYNDPEFPEEVLVSLKEQPLSDVIATATAMGIQLKQPELDFISPRDYIYASEDYIREDMFPDDIRMNKKVFGILLPFAGRRSYHYPLVLPRLCIGGPGPLGAPGIRGIPNRLFMQYYETLPAVMEKQADLVSPATLLLMAALAKAGFPLLATKNVEKTPSALDIYRGALKEQAAALAAKRATELGKTEDTEFTFKTAAFLGPKLTNVFRDRVKTLVEKGTHMGFPRSAITGLAAGHTTSAVARNVNYRKLEKGERPSAVLDAVGKHPNLLAAGLTTALWPKGRKMVKVLFSK